MVAPTKASLGVLTPEVLDRGEHTGTQAISTVTGLQAALDGKPDDAEVTAEISAAIAALNLVASEWTPTLTNGANVAASTAFVCGYTRVLNQVHCWGLIQVDPTTASDTVTVVDISLPVPSNLSASTDLRGVAAAANTQRAGMISPNTANDRATLTFSAFVATNITFAFSFDYEVA